MRSMTLNEPSPFPPNLRKDIECICDSTEVEQACKEHTESPGEKILDKYFAKQLRSRNYSVKRDRLCVAEESKFDLDLLINGPNWRAAVLIEGGKAARIDLDLLKFIAWGRRENSADISFVALIASDKKLLRNITGTTGETAFDYLVRLRRLFSATGPKVADLLVVEFQQQKPISQGPQDQSLPITLDQVKKEVESMFGVNLTKLPKKRIIYCSGAQDNKSLVLISPRSEKLHPEGYGWVDITKIQSELSPHYSLAIIAFRLPDRKTYYFDFHELVEHLSEEAMMNNSHEGDHWKLHVHPGHIKIRKCDTTLLIKPNALQELARRFRRKLN